MNYKFDDFDLIENCLTHNGLEINLTKTELAILRHLLEHSSTSPEKPVPPDVIFRAVWPDDKAISLGKVNVHLSNLRRKLGNRHSTGRPYISHLTEDRRGEEKRGILVEAAVKPVSSSIFNSNPAPAIRIIIALVTALISTILFTVPVRATLALFDLTAIQVTSNGFIEGGFHGVAGAVLWSISIGLPLLVYWFVVEDSYPYKGVYSPLVGGLFGMIGGGINTFILLHVFGGPSLERIRWLPSDQSSFITTVTETGVAFVMPILGLFVGFGAGEISRRMLKWWAVSIKGAESENLEPEFSRVLHMIVLKVLVLSCWLLTCMTLAAIGLDRILSIMPSNSLVRGQIIGEAVSVFFGGIGLVVGIFAGLELIRKGIPSLQE